jgi:hypothetical protein
MLSSVSEFAHTRQGTSADDEPPAVSKPRVGVVRGEETLHRIDGRSKACHAGNELSTRRATWEREVFHQRGLSHSRRAGHEYNLGRALQGLAQTAVQLANSASRPTLQTSGAASGSYVCLMTQHPHPTCKAMPPERPSYTMPGRLPGASAAHRHASRGIRWHGAPPHAFDEITASRVPWP